MTTQYAGTPADARREVDEIRARRVLNEAAPDMLSALVAASFALKAVKPGHPAIAVVGAAIAKATRR